MSERRRTDPLPLGGDEPYSKGLMARALIAVAVPADLARLGVDQTFTGENTFTNFTVFGATSDPLFVDDATFEVTGNLTIKGVTRPTTFALEVNGFGPDAYGGIRAGFSATATVNRNDFGVDIAMPLDGGGTDGAYLLLDSPSQQVPSFKDWLTVPPSKRGQGQFEVVTGDYFKTMQIPLLR